ncbi:MAG: LAGLIDADG family homing endonuclease [Candidatus Hodarchaeaceae archaeon]|nr:LAGLIDADG family homing endonuclease [Candidatus Hodarchaeaceae archaeon]
MGEINVAIAGVGNCASSLVQGIECYREAREDQFIPGLMHVNLGGYHIRDVKFVAAFDVDANKVGRDLAEAIFTPPNCTVKFSDVPKLGVEVVKGPVLDGLGKYLKSVIPLDRTQEAVDVAQVLKDARADVLVSYLPVGSYEASRHYAQQAIKAGCGFINCIPEFIVSSKEWGKRFTDAGLPCAGDDIKSQVGATILHRTLARLLIDRGVKLEESYQLNIGGNSVTGDEEILLEVDGALNRTRIGDFIDKMMEKYGFVQEGGKEVLETNKMKEKIRCFTINDDYKLMLAPVTKLIRHKIDESLFEVTLAKGNRIKITGDHNLFTLDEDGNLKSIPVKELKQGQTFIAIPTTLSPGEELSHIDLTSRFSDTWAAKVGDGEFLKTHNHPEIRIPVKFPVSKEFLDVIGLWLADGSFDRSGSSNLEIAVGDEPECLDVITRWTGEFNIRCERRGKGGVAVRIHSKTLASIAKKIFRLSGNCYTKRVPGWVFNLSEKQICEVLKGYFSGDGCVIGNQIRWTSTSSGLVRDIQTLLLQVGIHSTVFKENKRGSKTSYRSTAPFWHGIISSKEALGAFLEKVGFLQSRKNEMVKKVVQRRKFEKSFIPKIRLIEESGIEPTTTRDLPAIEKRTILSQLDCVKDKSISEKLKKLCTGEIEFVKVKNIKKLELEPQYVYDLSVEHYERFICSNILVHNTDFLNMLEEERLSSKRISKTEAVASQVPYEVPLRIGPSDYVSFLKDNKICYIHMRGRKFGDVPLTIDVKLSVEDSPNSAGVVIDAIRAVKLALDRGIGGPLIGVSAYFFKHPPIQMSDVEAKQAVEDFISGRGER